MPIGSGDTMGEALCGSIGAGVGDTVIAEAVIDREVFGDPATTGATAFGFTGTGNALGRTIPEF